MQPLHFNYNGPDENLDVVVALLVRGMYPNICFHKEKRKLVTMENRPALIHKSSVNFSKFEQKFPSPFFTFAEKVGWKALDENEHFISWLQMTCAGVHDMDVCMHVLVNLPSDHNCSVWVSLRKVALVM